jgi:hypothetical protein
MSLFFGGQVLVWPSGLRSRNGCFGGVGKGKNEELVEKRAVPIIAQSRKNAAEKK